MVITVDDYEHIRKHYLNGESQRSIARSLGISRNTVAKYCKGAAVPWERKTPERQSSVITDEVSAFILSCLEEDNKVSFKNKNILPRGYMTGSLLKWDLLAVNPKFA